LAPPAAPKVTCVGDQLTISANNSTLKGVLAAVRSCIGISVEIPEDAAEDRLFEDIGPGPARQVLESLLSGTDLNFVIGSSEANPYKVSSVILLTRAPIASASNNTPDRALTPARRAWLQSRQNARPNAASSDEIRAIPDEPSDSPAVKDTGAGAANSAKVDASQASPNDAAVPSSEPPAPPTAGVAAASATAPEPAYPSSNSSAGQDKSAAERIADMQQMFEQRRQLNQSSGQNPSPTSPQP